MAVDGAKNGTTTSREVFDPTSGRFIGPLGLLVAAAIGIGGVLNVGHGFPLPVVAGALLFAALTWSAIIRPRIWLEQDDLVLRNMFETVTVPLAAVQDLVIRQLFVIKAGDKRFVSAAVGRSHREVTRGRMEAVSVRRKDQTRINYADYVHDRVRARVDDECTRLGVRQRSPEQAALGKGLRRQPAWLEIGMLVVSGALLVGSLFV